MTAVSVVYALLFYAAFLIFIIGLVRRILIYKNAQSPLKIPTTPAPVTKTGVVFRMFREVVFFESLFKSNKWIWLFGWLFHFSMLVVLLRHLRYVTNPVWDWVVFMSPYAAYLGFTMLFALLGLWARRLLVDRVRYISNPSDHLMLMMLVGIAGTGLLMKFYAHTDVIKVKSFMLGLMYFNWHPLPDVISAGDAILLVHLALIIVLLLVFAYSKLLHAPGVFFSPTRNQVDNPREHRFISDWAAKLETKK